MDVATLRSYFDGDHVMSVQALVMRSADRLNGFANSFSILSTLT
eukprot:CAMPEP_0113233796 /NCGR_PEP_ID=MMETSP0008_2-20120614/2677_1 /TAXON_ID=97485 /ORGANISM="Prymnesium parvum" /LENGTH=43 /DNA_ID=CAMNT_0000080607 /DNA_START=144 /DNA_END=271 /DNA_ORIENTATION=- /assembly_acc=CAM_ASM_000153